jgi:SNF family Na+-dependent transporter
MMPDIFKTVPFGQIWHVCNSFRCFFTVLTSIVGVLEVVVKSLQNKFKMSRWLSIGNDHYNGIGNLQYCNKWAL